MMVFVRLPNDDELLTLRLWEAGTLGITEGDGFIDAFFEDAETASKFGVPEAVTNVDWVARTQEGFPPLLVGEKFFLAAPWRRAGARFIVRAWRCRGNSLWRGWWRSCGIGFRS